jgi:Outer membrane receptor proteins, mostly Fe transport
MYYQPFLFGDPAPSLNRGESTPGFTAKINPAAGRGLRALAVIVAGVCSTLAAAAQQASTDREEEIVELSPFVISTQRDTGWVASSTLVGNRTNTSLVNVPVTVDAITSEFMQDLGAYTLEDTALWVANLDVVNELETAAEEQRVNYRGMQLGGREVPQSSRNFFSWYTPTDTYNIDRIDFSKGSNSLMFGDSTPGGLATSYTKRANIGNSFGKVTARVDSEGSHRVQFDYNQHINEKLAVRVNMVSRDDSSYMDFAHSSLNAAHGAVTFRPFHNTLLRAEAEVGKFKRKRASNLLKIRETPAPGRGFSSNNRWYVTSDGEIIQRTGSNPPAVDRTGAGGDQLSLMEGQSVTITLPNGSTKTFTGYDRDVNLKGTIDYLDRPFNNLSVYLEQKVGDLHFEVAYNMQNQQQDRIDATFGTTVSVDGSGRPFLDSELNRREFGDRVQVLRASASYPFEIGKWTKQFLVVSGEYQKHRLENFRQNLANFAVLDNGVTNIANHRIMARAYLDDPMFPSAAFWDQFLPENLPQTSTFRPGWYETTSDTLPFVDDRISKSLNASISGEYWNGRIRSLLGVRYDGFDRKMITDLPTDEIGQSIFLGYPSDAPAAYSYLPEFDLDNTSYTTGLVFGLTENVNVYATYSESFRWQAATDFTDEALGPELGETKEVGIKGFFMDNKLAATVAFYEIEQFNSRFVWNPNLLTAAEMEELFNPNDLMPSSPGYFIPSAGLNSEARTVTSSEHAKGVEFTLQWQRWHGLQARLTYSHNKLGITRDFSKFKAMYEAARQRTDQALAGGNPAMAESEALLADALAILQANDGVTAVTGSRSVPDSVNWLLDYKLPKGGFWGDTRVALYGNWRSDYNIELLGNQMYRGGATHPIGAYIIHHRRIMDRATSFRLGLRNIVDLENSGKLRRVGVVRTDANNVPTDYEYRYLTPFSVDFSVTVDF